MDHRRHKSPFLDCAHPALGSLHPRRTKASCALTEERQSVSRLMGPGLRPATMAPRSSAL
eukprot:4706793-Alexandrium_andersonii.AAC.1